VQTEGAAINTEREQIEADRAALAREQSEFTSQREAALRERDAKAERLQQAIDSHSGRVAEWKQRAVDFSESNRIGPAADRERRALDREQAEINAAGTDLEAKSAAFTRENASLVASLNKRAEAVNARIGEIEGRRNKYNERAEALSDPAPALRPRVRRPPLPRGRREGDPARPVKAGEQQRGTSVETPGCPVERGQGGGACQQQAPGDTSATGPPRRLDRAATRPARRIAALLLRRREIRAVPLGGLRRQADALAEGRVRMDRAADVDRIRPISIASAISPMRSPACVPTMPPPTMRCVSSSNSSLVKPSSRRWRSPGPRRSTGTGPC